MCVCTMPRERDTTGVLTEAIVAAHQSEKGNQSVSKQIGVQHYVVCLEGFSVSLNTEPQLRFAELHQNKLQNVRNNVS